MRTAEEFWGHVQRGGADECWLWLAGRTTAGYGHLTWGVNKNKRRDGDKKRRYAHRISWTLTRGKIPIGICVLHKCDNPPCVNPSHLFLGTYADNARDKCAKGRDHESQKTHCPQGHPYSEENTYRDSLNHRWCRACHREANHRYRQRQAQQ